MDMIILQNKRDQFRVEIRKDRNEQLFQQKRKLTLQLNSNYYLEVLNIKRIKEVISKYVFKYIISFYSPQNELNLFHQSLFQILDQPFTFPYEFLTELLSIPFNPTLNCLITTILAFMYERGLRDGQNFIEYMFTSELRIWLLEFLKNRLDQDTAVQCVQLICASIQHALTYADKKTIQAILNNVSILYPILEAWLHSKEICYVKLALSAFDAIAQKIELIDKVSNQPLFNELCKHEDIFIKKMSLQILCHISSHGNDYHIGQLIDHGVLDTIRLLTMDDYKEVRQRCFLLLGNICLFEKFIDKVIDQKQLMKSVFDLLEHDYYAISKECCYILFNISQLTDLMQLELEYSYVEYYLNINIKQTNLENDVVDLCLQQIQAICQIKPLKQILLSMPSLVNFLIEMNNTRLDRTLDQILKILL